MTSATASRGVAQAEADHHRAAARSAAEAGADAYDEGRYDRSLELFSRAEELMHAPPHLLFIARSLAKLGRIVEAREAYLKIINEQLPDTAPTAFKAAHKQAESEIEDVEARIAYVTVTIRGGNAVTAQLTVDHEDVPAAEQGIPLPMNPGTHIFSAHAGQKRSAEKAVLLREGAKQTVDLTLPAGIKEMIASPEAPPSATIPSNARGAVATGHAGSDTAKRIVAYSALGVGAVGLGVGTYFLTDYLKWRHRADDRYECNATQSCTDDDKAVIAHYDHMARIPRTWAIVSYGIGAAGIATGVVLLVAGHGAAGSAAATQGPELRVSAGLSSLALSGQF